MQYRSVDKGGDLFSILEHQQKLSHRALGINKLNKVMDWEAFRGVLEEFLGLRPGDSVPDQNTIWDFRESLEADGRSGTRLLFKRFEQILNKEGLVGREGSMVDATFVDAPRQRNTRAENQFIKEGQRRPEGFEQDTAKGRQKDCEARLGSKE